MKLIGYRGLVSECQQARWRARCLPVEVRCRGLAAKSLSRAFRSLGIEGVRERRAICKTTKVAAKASRWLWLKRGEPWETKQLASHLDTSWGLISLSRVAWRKVFDVERPKTPNDSRNITVRKYQQMYLHSTLDCKLAKQRAKCACDRKSSYRLSYTDSQKYF